MNAWISKVWPKVKPYAAKAAYSILLLLAGAIAHRYGFAPPDVANTVLDEVVNLPPAKAQFTTKFAFGWHDAPEEVAKIKAGLKHPVFAQTPAGRVTDLPDHSYLWDASTAALGNHVPTRNQGQVGSCTAFGATCAAEYLQVQAIVACLKAGQPPPVFKDLAQETIYGLGRVQVGQDVNDREDGATGAWMAQAS